jgi:hypothetical protein
LLPRGLIPYRGTSARLESDSIGQFSAQFNAFSITLRHSAMTFRGQAETLEERKSMVQERGNPIFY